MKTGKETDPLITRISRIFRSNQLAQSPPRAQRYDIKMKNLYVRSLIPFLCICAIARSLPAQSPAPVEKPKQFIYVLHLAPRRYDDKAWTAEDKAAVDRHSVRSREATKSGQIILAGRTREPGDKTF